ncbi:Spc98 family-domain-containing protein [Dioszegia hungarica]|uniref:Spindle pole body component n=1 Tax=Dioszegia hungarica TaxID=4972 RepID=A0AA38H1M1_9TREE|nr:Spc98 family-domain-containing protein [Dioszegia hungarica]KAI9632365.1 Spc98 family-domain-containing protein [Dioszegia hungarica]
MTVRTPSKPDSLSALTFALITSFLPGTSASHADLSQLQAWALRELRNDAQGSTRREWEDVRRTLEGLRRKAGFKVQDALEGGLGKVLRVLESQRGGGGREWDEGLPITVSNLAQHVQLLLNLSTPPTAATHDLAESYLIRQPPSGPTADQILYAEIMSTPFRGEHWGASYDEEVHSGWSESSGSSSHDGSSSDEEQEQVWTPTSARVAKAKRGTADLTAMRRGLEEEERAREARAILEDLGERSYWRKPGVEVEPVPEGVYGWKEMSTGVSSFALSERILTTGGRVKLISAAQLQREMLFALSGRPNLLLNLSDAAPYCTIIPDHPNTIHYSRSALHGILLRLEARSAQLAQLRTASQAAPTSKTHAAFIESLRSVLQGISTWISELESDLIRGCCQAPGSSFSAAAAGTPISLLLAFDTAHGDILDYLTSALPSVGFSVRLTNTLYTIYTSSLPSKTGTSQRLLDIFIDTAEPLWRTLGRWLQEGMPIPSTLLEDEVLGNGMEELDDEKAFDEEFWIRRDRDVSWADEDFWECAWVVQGREGDGDGGGGWPVWLEEGVRGRIIEAGKARGLLRGLKTESGGTGRVTWKTLREVLRPSTSGVISSVDVHSDTKAADNVDSEIDIRSTILTVLKPICDLAIAQMRSVLEDECGLMAHLEAVEGTMYMRSFGVVDEWSGWLYAQVSEGRTWADFQTLSSTYREIIRIQGETWMNAPAIRLSLASRLKDQTGVAAIGLIKVDYQVPFPLSQLFSPTSMELRAEVFTFLLQFGYAREGVRRLHSDALRGKGLRGAGREMRRVLGMKQRLIWVLDTIWVWIRDRVIEPLTRAYRARLAETMSLGEMIQLELAHTRAIRKYCFLHDSTSIINGCIHDLLDLSQTLVDCFLAAEAEVRSTSLLLVPKTPQYVTGRSRRRQRRAGAGAGRRRIAVESDSDSGADDEGGGGETTGQEGTVSFSGLSPGKRVERMEERMEEVVQVFKDGVEDLTLGEGGGTDAAEREIWGMLSFALEYWQGRTRTISDDIDLPV